MKAENIYYLKKYRLPSFTLVATSAGKTDIKSKPNNRFEVKPVFEKTHYFDFVTKPVLENRFEYRFENRFFKPFKNV